MFELVMSILIILLVVITIIIQNRMLEKIRSDVQRLNEQVNDVRSKVSINNMQVRAINLDLQAHKAMSNHEQKDKDAETANQ